MVQSGFAPGVTRWNLKDRAAASASNRIGLDFCWSRLAALSCWPRLPSELKRTSLTPSGVAPYLARPSVLAPSSWHKCEVPTSSDNVRLRGQSGSVFRSMNSPHGPALTWKASSPRSTSWRARSAITVTRRAGAPDRRPHRRIEALDTVLGEAVRTPRRCHFETGLREQREGR